MKEKKERVKRFTVFKNQACKKTHGHTAVTKMTGLNNVG